MNAEPSRPWPIQRPQPLTRPPLRQVSHVDPPLAPPHHTWCDPISIFVDPDMPSEKLEQAIVQAFADFFVAGYQDLGVQDGERCVIVYRATPNGPDEPTLN